METQSKFSKKMKSMFSFFRLQESGTQPSYRRTMVIVGDGECGKTSLVTRMTSGHFVEVGYVPTVFETHVMDVHTGRQHVQLCVNDTAGQEDYDRLRPFSYHDIDVVLICFSLADPDSLINVHENWSPEIRYFCGNVPVILVGNKKDLRDSQSSSQSSSTRSSIDCLDASKTDDCESTDAGKKEPECDNDEDKKDNAFSSTETSVVETSPSHVDTNRPAFNAHAPVKHSEGALMATRIGAHAYFETSALTGDNVAELLLATSKAAVLGFKKSKKFKPFSETLKSWRSVNHLAK